MKKNEQNSGTSTPSAPKEAATGSEIVSEAAAVVYEFPRVQDVGGAEPVMFGDRKELLRVSDTEMVEIDAYFFASPTNLKLKNIKPALSGLKKQGVRLPDGKEIDSQWFNTNVRDPFHKVLRYAHAYSAKHGAPVSLAFTRRTNKDTGVVTTTAKHGFEFKSEPTKPEEIEETADKAATKEQKKETAQSKTRAKRQQKKGKNLQPLVTPETANRIAAMIAETEAAKAAANGAPAPTPEQK